MSLALVAPTAQQSGARMPLVPFLALTLVLPAIIVIGNCVLGALTPITDGAEDDMSDLDLVWRLVQGQHVGIDFHDAKGLVFSKWRPCYGVSLDRTITSCGRRPLCLRLSSYVAAAS
jgi:hypothetical protein